ncbi:MAG: hypothetical protein PHG66_06115 [Candidatus Colwellbacteria bacterium]|nr:hypothetical protein [Candidatus Colwellbacteria bacterium]
MSYKSFSTNMAVRLNDLTVKVLDQSKRDADTLRSDCDKRFHECVLNTIRTGLDQYAKDGRTKVDISLYQMHLIDTCNPIAVKVMADYVKKNPVVDGVRLSTKTYYDDKLGSRHYYHGGQYEVTFDWTKPIGGFFSAKR